MKSSVVMATYNANKKYLKEQLDSIAKQSVVPDEVLIFDDRSKDDTVLFIQEYIRENNLTSWKLIINEVNKGYRRNFMEGTETASGDLIFFSDQDDIWHIDKIKIMKAILEKRDDIQLLICGFEHINAVESVTDFSSYGNTTVSKLKNTKKNSSICLPGCTYCLRKTHFDHIKSAWEETLAHDQFLYLCSWMTESIFQTDSVLHFYRRHDAAVSYHVPPEFDKQKRYLHAYDIFRAYTALSDIYITDGIEISPIVKKYGKFLYQREIVLNKSNIIDAVYLLKYLGFYKSIKTYGVDILPRKICSHLMKHHKGATELV